MKASINHLKVALYISNKKQKKGKINTVEIVYLRIIPIKKYPSVINLYNYGLYDISLCSHTCIIYVAAITIFLNLFINKWGCLKKHVRKNFVKLRTKKKITFNGFL